MYSVSSDGVSKITLQFGLTLNIDTAEQEVQAAINASATLLPPDLPTPPVYNKINPADVPFLSYAVTSKILPLPEIENLVDNRMAQKISQISGVGLVSIAGGQRPAIRVHLNPAALAAYGLGFGTIRTAIVSANVDRPKGDFDGGQSASSISTNDQLNAAEDYRKIILGYHKGSAIRLADVADVVEGIENMRLAAWADRAPAIIVNIQRQPGSNLIEVADSIKRLLPELKATLPGALDVTLLNDRTVTIRSSLSNVKFELALSIVLVVLVIYVFLHHASATFIPAVTVPLSLIGTFIVLYLCGYSVNNLTLMALTIATGFVVDDAIVMIENIARYIEDGDPPLKAALKGSAQMGFTIISLTLSLIAVLLPLLLMGDIVGRLFHEFAVTLIVSILISAFISLTLTPMMCAKMLRPTSRRENRFHATMEHLLAGVIRGYGRMLNAVLRRQDLMLMAAAAMLLFTIILYIFIPKGFFPQQDTGLLQGVTEARGDISFTEMARRQQALVNEILKSPSVENVASFIGADEQNAAVSSGTLLIRLKPFGARDDAGVIMRQLQESAGRIADIALFLQPVQDLTVENHTSRTQYIMTVEDVNPDELGRWVIKLVNKLKTRPELAGVASDEQNHGMEAHVQVNRDNALKLGVNMSAIDDALYDAFGQRQISTVFTQYNQYHVVMDVGQAFQKDPAFLSRIYVASASADQDPKQPPPLVPLGAIADISVQDAPLVISHLGQFPAATISFNLAPGESLGGAVEAIRNVEKELNLPPGVKISFQGSAKAFGASLDNMPLLLLAAIATMYIVLGILYESYIHPVTILSTLPSAAIGALLLLLMLGRDLDIVAVIGIVLLIGIVKKNAIIMIDFALEAQRVQGMDARKAIYQACMLRFRPILMTTLCALFGALPLMMGTGSGAELRQPLGITIVGGLMLSQLLTLFTTPVIYLAFERLSRRAARFHTARILPGIHYEIYGFFHLPACGDDAFHLRRAFVRRGRLFLLPVSPLPQIDLPTISVQTSLRVQVRRRWRLR